MSKISPDHEMTSEEVKAFSETLFGIQPSDEISLEWFHKIFTGNFTDPEEETDEPYFRNFDTIVLHVEGEEETVEIFGAQVPVRSEVLEVWDVIDDSTDGEYMTHVWIRMPS